MPFTEEIQKAVNYNQRYSASLIIRKMQMTSYTVIVEIPVGKAFKGAS